MRLWLNSFNFIKRQTACLLTGALFVLLVSGSATGAVAADETDTVTADTPQSVAQAVAQAPATVATDFGSPPSGEIPILYNDHTVYAKPDVLKQGRVLAALLRGGQIFVPLQSMFEEMGATVSASADGTTIKAVKDTITVSVTVGKPEVIVNGEVRPLDVPPMLYHGIVLVPLRVISEALGAYVLWVPEKRVVVVRYIPPTPPPVIPTAAPTSPPAPAPVPTPTPTPTPTPRSYQGYIEGAFAGVRNYDEFSSGQYCHSFVISGAWAFKDSRFAVKVDYRQYSYVTSSNVTDSIGNQYTGFATIDGGYAFTPVFLAQQSTLDGRVEYEIAAPRIYVGLSYLTGSNNYGYPHVNGIGFGLEKLLDLRPGINPFGSVFYYPSAGGNYTVTSPASSNFGNTYQQRYGVVKFDVGLALVAKHIPVYVYGGYSGDSYGAKQNAPIGQTHYGPYVGLGLKL